MIGLPDGPAAQSPSPRYPANMRVKQLLPLLQEIAPEHLAEDWDRVGLQIGDGNWPVRHALLCIDLTEAVLAEAIRKKSGLIVAYHPPIFAPLDTVTGVHWKQRVVMGAIAHRIAAYSPHTALDAAAGGINDWLADGVAGNDRVQRRVITPRQAPAGESCKVVTFVPEHALAQVRLAMVGAGAGMIRGYTQCSFAAPGRGTFCGGSTTKPVIGQRGRLEAVNELRLEMICPVARLPQVIAALVDEHPYEEPAYDVYVIANQPADASGAGQGRVVEFARPITLATLVRRIKTQLQTKHLQVAAGQYARNSRGIAMSTKVRRIGLCAGAGGSLLGEAGDIDVFFTGEMRHHHVLDAAARGVSVILAGHTQTERPYLPVYRRRLAKFTSRKVKWSVSRVDHAVCDLV